MPADGKNTGGHVDRSLQQPMKRGNEDGEKRTVEARTESPAIGAVPRTWPARREGEGGDRFQGGDDAAEPREGHDLQTHGPDEEQVRTRVERSAMSAADTKGEVSTSGASPERLDYLKWSCERLEVAHEHETSRADRIRDQASTVFLALPVFVGLVVSSDAWKEPGTAMFLCRLLTLGCAGWSLVAWYRVMRVGKHPEMATDVFTIGEDTDWKDDVEKRVRIARTYLLEAVKDGQERGDALANGRRHALLASVATLVFAGLPLLLKELR